MLHAHFRYPSQIKIFYSNSTCNLSAKVAVELIQASTEQYTEHLSTTHTLLTIGKKWATQTEAYTQFNNKFGLGLTVDTLTHNQNELARA